MTSTKQSNATPAVWILQDPAQHDKLRDHNKFCKLFFIRVETRPPLSFSSRRRPRDQTQGFLFWKPHCIPVVWGNLNPLFLPF